MRTKACLLLRPSPDTGRACIYAGAEERPGTYDVTGVGTRIPYNDDQIREPLAAPRRLAMSPAFSGSPSDPMA
jgi:hypothetical protein